MSPAGRLWLGWWWRATRREMAWAWGAWRLGGAPLMLAFLLGCAGVALVSGWPLLPPAPAGVPWALPATLACGWLLSGLRGSRPGLHPRGLEWAALRGPVAPAWALTPALARTALPGTLTGLALGAGLLVWSPALWPLALSLPWLGVARALLHAARHGRRMAGQSGESVTALAAGPLLGLLHPALLPVGAALAAVEAGVIWARTLADDLPPRLSAQLEVEAVRAGARRFGLPVPDVNADGYQPPRRWAPALRRMSPGGALWWRGALHLTRRRSRLLRGVLGAALAGAGVALGQPVLAGLLLLPALGLRAPTDRPAAPRPGRRARLAGHLPAGLTLGGAALLGAALAGGGALLLLTAALTPWAALGVRAALGESVGDAGLAGQLPFAAALAPGVSAALLGGFGAAALAPLALLALGWAALAF
ncbi:hypothetical protein GCM10008956_10470 [Deinococcus arenae]|uniref:Uncharacterized protein n=1 Tax=Deinococcus arenae TaxID=1452751 RepID=A0A8H9GL37_9DEIO|nr:hypothetical protein [Deinococcus arenae]AWT35312.1 hypothetical protein DM785_06905 [Deinococcus actinosclerus]GGM35852.1 hypothetical protein GCM10008956_10470 [Deinococcus arenae]